MPLAVKDNESPNPRDVGIFGTAAKVTNVHRLAHTIEQPWFGLLAGYRAGGSGDALG
jgi:hypothetical protein